MRRMLLQVQVVTVFVLLSVSWWTAAAPMPIRGTLPWHNFLSGPTAWDEEDYVAYLDRMQALGLNYVTFHCYTGGAERYATYVEPLIRMEYRNVVPTAGLDTSLTARWGYRPLPVAKFAFGSDQIFKLPFRAKAFGARSAVLARDDAAQYDGAQKLMRRVMQQAHKRGIQVGLGFEFGMHPPEFASLVPPESWIRGAMLPDPTHPAAIEILRHTLDDILRAYPEIDWIWLWLHEHTMMVGAAKPGGAFKKFQEQNAKFFADADAAEDVFTGVWSLAYIRQAYDYLQQRAPRVRLAISGWGGGTQLPGILRGLDRALPKEIVFTCLNPHQGWSPQPAVLAEIARHREVWAIPWLEGDVQLWHLQPRVNLLRQHVQLAQQQGLNGVIAIHWRTEEIRANLEAFARFAADPTNAPSVEQFYLRYFTARYGQPAAAPMTTMFAQLDREQTFATKSPEYYPYDPSWGRLKPDLRSLLTRYQAELKQLSARAGTRYRYNFNWLIENFEFTLLLDEVSRQVQPAYDFKERFLRGEIPRTQLLLESERAWEALSEAPMEKLFRACARKVRSRGELGELSALNQKLWLQYLELKQFLAGLEKLGRGGR